MSDDGPGPFLSFEFCHGPVRELSGPAMMATLPEDTDLCSCGHGVCERVLCTSGCLDRAVCRDPGLVAPLLDADGCAEDVRAGEQFETASPTVAGRSPARNRRYSDRSGE
ncbi:hypothetical protein GCM10027091_18260 [Streptomyces daliensis]